MPTIAIVDNEGGASPLSVAEEVEIMSVAVAVEAVGGAGGPVRFGLMGTDGRRVISLHPAPVLRIEVSVWTACFEGAALR